MWIILALAAFAIVYWLAVRSRPVFEEEADDLDAGDRGRDAWEGSFFEARDPKKVDCSLEIVYTDGNGQTTRRIVDVRAFDDQLHKGIILGHCHLRSANRTFRLDRIEEATDVRTGEVIGDTRAYLRDLYEQSPERSCDRLREEFADTLKTLLFVAKADGQYRSPEKLVIREFLRELAGDARISDDSLDDLMAHLEVPSLHGFKMAVGRALGSPAVDGARLRKACRDIVATQKTVSAGEAEALEYLDRKSSAT